MAVSKEACSPVETEVKGQFQQHRELAERHLGLWAQGRGLPCVSSGKASLRRQDLNTGRGSGYRRKAQRVLGGQKEHCYQRLSKALRDRLRGPGTLWQAQHYLC